MTGYPTGNVGFEGLRKVSATRDCSGCATKFPERVSQTTGLYSLRVPEAGLRALGASGAGSSLTQRRPSSPTSSQGHPSVCVSIFNFANLFFPFFLSFLSSQHNGQFSFHCFIPQLASCFSFVLQFVLQLVLFLLVDIIFGFLCLPGRSIIPYYFFLYFIFVGLLILFMGVYVYVYIQSHFLLLL